MFEALTLDDLVIRGSSHTPFFGVYLATHAISDGLCMCHASVGCKVKTQDHLVRHDGVADSHSRRRYSQFIDEDLISGSTAQLEEEIVAWQRRQSSGVVVIDSSTPISLQANSLAGVIQRMEKATAAHVVHVDARNYERDLFTGYAATISAVLRRLAEDNPRPARRADEVSLIGNLFDRYEPDQFGNVAELRRMLGALGFKVPAVFFAGEPYRELKNAMAARTHIVLPYAASETKTLQSLGLDHVEAPLPMSIGGTKAFLLKIARHLGVSQRAEAFIAEESARLRPLMELARREIGGRNFGVFAEAPRAAGIVATLVEAGMNPAVIGVLHFDLGGRERVERELKEVYGVELRRPVHWLENPTPAEVRAAPIRECRVVIGPSVERENASPHPAWIEHGFPSNDRHFLSPAPYVGFNGALRLLEQVVTMIDSTKGMPPPK